MVKQIKEAANNGLQFAKQLATVITAISVLGLGAYAVYLGRSKIALMLGSAALIFSGILACVVGLGLLYKALMRKGSNEQ